MLETLEFAGYLPIKSQRQKEGRFPQSELNSSPNNPAT